MRTRILFFISTLLWCSVAFGQEPGQRQTAPLDINDIEPTSSLDMTTTLSGNPLAAAQPGYALGYQPVYDDSLHLPLMDASGRVLSLGYLPFGYMYGMSGWPAYGLHRGLNLSVGASVFAQFGKHARGGVGFSQQVSALYAVPLTDRLSLAVGGYFDRIQWHNNTVHDAGLTAVLGYQFNEHWEAYLYAQKSLVNNHDLPYYLYGMGPMGDRIGGAVKYNFNPSMSIQVSVEHIQRPQRDIWQKSQPPYRGNRD